MIHTRMYRRFAFLTISLSVSLAAAPAHASGQEADADNLRSRFRTEVSLFRSSLTHGLSAPARWDFETARAVAGATVLVVALSAGDDHMRDVMSRNQSEGLDAAARVINPLGLEATIPLVGAFLGAGLLWDQPHARVVGAEAAASSIIASGIITPAIKLVLGRARPHIGAEPYTFDPFSGAQSFPSGHTTQAFAIASVIAGEYDETWVRLSAYGVASLVAAARMYSGEHYLSDVVAGAMIGTAVGVAVVRHGDRSRDGESARPADGRTSAIESAFVIEPVLLSDGGAGIQFRMLLP